MAGRTGAGLGLIFFYLDENRYVGVESCRRFMEPRLPVEVVGTAKRGKCFHTGNMAFPWLGRFKKIRDWLLKVCPLLGMTMQQCASEATPFSQCLFAVIWCLIVYGIIGGIAAVIGALIYNLASAMAIDEAGARSSTLSFSVE
jgi:hypothetical protein